MTEKVLFDAAADLYARRKLTDADKEALARFDAAADLLESNTCTNALDELVVNIIKNASQALSLFRYYKAEGQHTIVCNKRYN